MINKPLVSICIPCYNASKFIAETIESIITQTYGNIEIIIVDDGSTDNSVDIIIKIKKKYFGTKISLYQQKNQGQCSAANKAFKMSGGEYIKFLDADDLLNSNHIEEQLLALNGKKNCIAAGQVRRFYDDNIETALYEPLANWKNMDPIDWLLVDGGKGLGMMQCGLFIIPREVLTKSGLWDERLSLINDFEFFPRVLLSTDQILFTEKAEIYYRSGTSNSLSNVLSNKALQSAFTALSLTTNRILGFENSKRSREIMGSYWALWAYHFYPNQNKLFSDANEEILMLTGKKFSPNHTGISEIAAKVIGWKLTKRLKNLFRI